MKSEEKNLARELRRQGFSYNEILEQVTVSKGTLSLWLRDITLTEEQIARLEARLGGGREKFILSMRTHRDARWAGFQQEAEEEYAALSQDPEFMFGLALYIGEGSKTAPNELCLTNCDSGVIRHGLRFFLKIGVPYQQIRCAIGIHPGLSKEAAQAYWQDVTGLPRNQFHTVREVASRASSGKKGHLQIYGTCQLRASVTKIRQKVHRWMELALI
ncbi:MAG: hypothetical protein M3Y28_01220 [Armatimonadota bacterium]|nr:hypothetical protein [Armatimonadota bacterium]